MTTSAYSRIEYTQTAEAVDAGGVTYQVVAKFTPIDGDLPPGVTGVFVYRIVSLTDPKADVFARIAALADLSKASATRDLAVAGTPSSAVTDYGLVNATTTGERLYLGNTITLKFNDLQVALQARQVIEQRIDQLLLDWKTYRDKFVGAASTAFPLFSAPIVTAAKDAYYAAIDARDAANAAVTEATEAQQTADANYQTANTELARIQALRPNVCPPAGALNTFSGSLNTFFAAATDFAPKAVSAYGVLNTHTASSATLASKITDLLANMADATKKTAVQTALADYNNTASLTTVQLTNLSGAAAFQTALNTVLAAKPQGFTDPLTQIQTACTTLQGQETAASQAKAVAQVAADKARTDASSAQAKSAAATRDAATALAAVLAVCPSFDPTA